MESTVSMKEEEPESISLNSQEMQEIVGKVPPWILRYGIFWLFIIVAILTTASCFIDYPEILRVPILITSTSPARPVSSASGGKITKIYFKDGEIVKKGEIVAIFEASGDYDSILKLEKELENYKDLLPEYSKNHHATFDKYGDITPAICKLQSVFESYLEHKNNEVQSKKIYLIRNRLREIESILDDSVFNASDKSRIIIDKTNLEERLLTLESNYHQESQDNEHTISDAVADLKIQIAIWKSKCVLQSPDSGRIFFTKSWMPLQSATPNEIIFNVIPAPGKPFAKAYIPFSLTKGLVTEKEFNIKFPNSQWQQYGSVIGKISYISPIPINGNYSVLIEFPHGLITSENKKIPLSLDINGEAELIVKDQTLFSRIFKQFFLARTGLNKDPNRKN